MNKIPMRLKNINYKDYQNPSISNQINKQSYQKIFLNLLNSIQGLMTFKTLNKQMINFIKRQIYQSIKNKQITKKIYLIKIQIDWKHKYKAKM